MDSTDRVWRERGLKEAVLVGNERAWKTLYDESFDVLLAYVQWRCGGRRDRAEDVVQETWLTAVRRVRAFDPDRGTFADWLHGIASNVLRNQFRRDATRDDHVRSLEYAAVSARSNDNDRPDEASDVSERIARTLTALPDRYEAALRAKYLEQQTVDQIAAHWNQTPKSIESLLTRARQAFREAFQKLE
jgi:RNA polymerase sigma-70 factor (ECF subfamily)